MRSGILDHIGILDTFPFIGPHYPRRSRGSLRVIVYRSYRIFYDVSEEAKKVDILHIRHGARDEPNFQQGLLQVYRLPCPDHRSALRSGVATNGTSNGAEGLKLLGHSETHYPSSPSADILETFPNRYPQRDYLIRFDCAEFTSVCPVTGQPDFAKIRIEYVADERCIETKSLKFYLASYRHTRSFNEEIANRILEDLVTACAPRRATVHGEFAARGGISVTVDASHPDEARPAAPRNGHYLSRV